jgi:hypothetical protein
MECWEVRLHCSNTPTLQLGSVLFDRNYSNAGFKCSTPRSGNLEIRRESGLLTRSAGRHGSCQAPTRRPIGRREATACGAFEITQAKRAKLRTRLNPENAR